MGKSKIYCAKCTKKCSGEVLRVTDKYFHKTCFQCTTCHKSLAAGGFFAKDGAYYCTLDYQKRYGTKCSACQQYVEGEVVQTMGNTYHHKCFTCSRCQQPFQSGSKVTNTGKEVLCEQCVAGPQSATAGTSTAAAASASSPSAGVNRCASRQQQQQQQHQQQVPTSPIKEITSSSPTKSTAQPQHASRAAGGSVVGGADYDPNDCAGCGDQLKEGQALVALERQWHIWCFRCKNCTAVLNGEYMGKDGVPYCEKCYQKLFGVKCAYCSRFISGKVLQAGENHHFHPTCARCTKCGDPFGDGEEMYLQGSAIWHPRCGPGPSAELGTILNGGGGAASTVGGSVAGGTNGHLTDTDCDRLSQSAMSEMQFSLRSRTPSINGSIYSPYSSRKYRTVSPGLVLREYGRPGGGYGYDDISRIYTYSYLTDEPHYLRKPIDPYDKMPVSPHFHRPTVHGFVTGSGGGLGGAYAAGGSRPPSRPQSRNKTAMKVLVDSIRTESPRPKSPGMNNEEPIELSHYPAAKKPPPGEKPKIERDDFPAPPYPYTDPERRRRFSESYTGVAASDDEDDAEVDEVDRAKGRANGTGGGDTDEPLRREAEELQKINSGMGAVILKDLKEQAKYRKWKQSHMDPRKASRTPSASREPVYRLRYESPLGASPSRHLDHQKPFTDDETTAATTPFDRSTSYRGSVGRSIGQAPSYNAIHSYRSPPKPGYGFKTSTLPSSSIGYRNGYSSTFSGHLNLWRHVWRSTGDTTYMFRGFCMSLIRADALLTGDVAAQQPTMAATLTTESLTTLRIPRQLVSTSSESRLVAHHLRRLQQQHMQQHRRVHRATAAARPTQSPPPSSTASSSMSSWTDGGNESGGGGGGVNGRSTPLRCISVVGLDSDYSFGGLGDKTHSTEFSCASVDSITEGDRQALMAAELPASSTYSGVNMSYHLPQTGLLRRSLPNMAHSMLVHEPAKIYPYHLLLITNYRLPADVDRCNLERHLSDVEFESILQCTRSEFYRMPQWRRNEIKRRARLF